MTTLKDLFTKLAQAYKENSQLERAYKNTSKGRAYVSRKSLIMSRQKFLEGRIREYGTIHNIILCRYRIKKKWYKLYLTSIELEDAKLMLSMLQPAAMNTLYEEINIGVPSNMD